MGCNPGIQDGTRSRLEDNIKKLILQRTFWRCGPHFVGLGWVPAADSFEHCDELSDCVKDCEPIDQLSDCKRLENESPRIYFVSYVCTRRTYMHTMIVFEAGSYSAKYTSL